MREITIDTDTVIGYDFENKYFYITNKGTTTTRALVDEAFKVLQVVAGENPVDIDNEPVTIDRLIVLSRTMETLNSLSYTWEDTGSYIKTIQLNDYEKYPITLDAEKNKLYIMNSTTIFDLTLNEGSRVHLEQLQAFYRDTIGLFIPLPDLKVLYDLLYSFYEPTCYNTIKVTTDNITDTYTMEYTDSLKLSNYNGKAPAQYTLRLNPTQQYTYEPIASVSNISENAITLTARVPSVVKPKTTINLIDTATQVDTTTYTADGTYVVQSVEGNTIYTTKNLPSNFSVTLPTLNIQAYINPIKEIDRDEQTITLTNSADNFLIGDTIVIRGTTRTTEYGETLTLDGFYTIIGIENNVLSVNEVPLTNFTATEEDTAYVYKPIQILTVTEINNKTITVAEEEFPTTLEEGTPLVIYTTVTGETGTTYMQYCTATELKQSHQQIKVDTSLVDNVPKYGILRQPIPYTYVLITIENSTDTEKLTNGEFMVDTHEQAINYLKLKPTLPVPQDEEVTEEVNNTGNMYYCNSQVRDYYIINMLSVGINRMTSKGVYTKVYTE